MMQSERLHTSCNCEAKLFNIDLQILELDSKFKEILEIITLLSQKIKKLETKVSCQNNSIVELRDETVYLKQQLVLGLESLIPNQIEKYLQTLKY